MNQTDPGLPLRCPKCRQPLRYIATKRGPHATYLYVCQRDGYFEFGLSDQKFSAVAPDLCSGEEA